MKFDVVSTPSLIKPFAVVPDAAVFRAVFNSKILCPFPAQPICAIPSISKSIDAEPTEQSAIL